MAAYYFNIDLTNHEIQNFKIHILASNPTPSGVGHTYFNSGSNKIRTWNGSSWDEYGTSTASGDVTGPASAVDNEIVLYSGTTGKVIKRLALTGALKVTSGVPSISTPLTEIDSLSPTNDDIIQRKAGSWTNRTMAQLKTDLVLNNVDNTSDATKNAATVTLTNKTINASNNTITNLSTTNFGAGVIVSTVDGGSTSAEIPTAEAVYAALQASFAVNDAMVLSGAIDCSTNPNYPAADAGNVYVVSVAGKIGGASGITVRAKATIYCLTDSTAAGNHATVGANWAVIQDDLDEATTSIPGFTTLATQAEAELKAVTNKAVTPAALVNFPIKKTFTIGNASATSFAITHSLGTKDVVITIRKASTDAIVYADIVNNTTNQSTITFTPYVPTSNEFVVTIIG